MIFRYVPILLILLTFETQAWNASVTPKYRFYPMTASVAASISKESLFWDGRTDESPWNYGMYRLGLNGGVEGTTEFEATVYPVSIVKLFAGIGGTYRFYKVPTFNCDLVNCSGFLQRIRLGFSFIVAFGESKEWILIPTYEQANVSAGSTQQMIADETENILAAASGDTYDSVSIVTGKKIGISLYGLYVKQGRYRSSSQFNEIQTALMKTDWRETSFTFGLGRYASSFYVPGVTFFMSYEWRWGKTQSLF